MTLLNRYRLSWARGSAWMALCHFAAIAAVYVAWNFLVKIDNSYFFYEYILKFIPFLLRAAPRDWFNTWEMGDPRPRLVMVLAEVANLHLRGRIASFATLPPACGINWLIYPLVCWVLFRMARLVSGNRFVALSIALLWALSPAALDSLAECYVPAKPLMNLWFALALLAGAELQAASEKSARAPEAKRVTGKLGLKLAVIIFLALLTDETAVIVMICLPVIFYRCFLRPTRVAAIAWGALLVPIGLFCLTALVVYPAINRAEGQVPLDFVQMVLKGPAIAYKGEPATKNISSEHLAGLAANFHPLGTAYTMVTAHLLPFRRVNSFWTSGTVLKFRRWPPLEWNLVILFAGISAAATLLLPGNRRLFVLALLLASGLLVIAYAVLLVPLAPAIVEVNYYGSLSSMMYALFVGFLFADLGIRRWQRLFALAAVLALSSLELLGYLQTAERNRAMFSNSVDFSATAREIPWNYGVLREIAAQVNSGRFREAAQTHPYPSRAFCYAFELEARREARGGQRIDFAQTESPDSLYGSLLQLHLLSLHGMIAPVVSTEPDLRTRLAQGGREASRSELRELLSNKSWYGASDDYSFTRSYFSNGRFVERYWIPFVMRVWRQGGQFTITPAGRLRLNGDSSNEQELRIIMDKGAYFAYDEGGRCIFRFQLVPSVDL